MIRCSTYHMLDQFYQSLSKEQGWKSWGCGGGKSPPRLEIVGESDTLSVDLNQYWLSFPENK